MGQIALAPGSLKEQIPDPVTEEFARRWCGKAWDDGDWETMSMGTGKVDKESFITVINVRNHAPSMRTWLECWRLDELTEKLEDLEIMCADDLCDVEPATLGAFYNSLKTVQKVHWGKVMAHATWLKAKPVGYMPWRPAAFTMWLESWRLGRIEPKLRELGVQVKEDVLDFDESYWPSLELRFLEQKRWEEAVQNLYNLIKSFNFASQRKANNSTFDTWLRSLRLTQIKEKLVEFGAVQLMDLDDLSEPQFKELRLTRLQEKHFRVGIAQIKAAKREAMADGKADLPNLRGCLESWRLSRVLETCEQLGAVTQQDLLDFEPEEYHMLKMRPLEAKRWVQMMDALTEEFDTPPPGEEWTEENMTRRAWRRMNANQYGYKTASKQTNKMKAGGLAVVAASRPGH